MPVNPRCVAVHGSYFARNFGDTLLVKIVCDWVAEIVGRENVYLAVPGHEQEQTEIGYAVVDPARRHAIKHLVFAGGGYFGEPNLSLLERYQWYFRNYQRHLSWVSDYSAARMAIFGIGVGPLTDPVFRLSVRHLMAKMDVLYVRDGASLDYTRLYRLNAERSRLGVDGAMSLSASHNSPRYDFGLHVSAMPQPVLERILDVLEKMGSEAGGSPPSILLLADTFVTREAQRRYADLATRFPGPLNVPRYPGVTDLIEQISDCATIITSKLHVGIVATALGRKVLSLPVHPKTRRFYADLSLQEFCLDEASSSSAPAIARRLCQTQEFAFDRSAVEARISAMRTDLERFLQQTAVQ